MKMKLNDQFLLAQEYVESHAIALCIILIFHEHFKVPLFMDTQYERLMLGAWVDGQVKLFLWRALSNTPLSSSSLNSGFPLACMKNLEDPIHTIRMCYLLTFVLVLPFSVTHVPSCLLGHVLSVCKKPPWTSSFLCKLPSEPSRGFITSFPVLSTL